jgi:ABC-2 type transport system permease protein
MFATLYVVFVHIFKLNKGVEHYPAYLLLGIVLWNFFVETTTTGMTAVVSRGDLIKKINIPRYLVVLSSSAAALINLGLNLIVVLGFALLNGIHPMMSWLWFPVILVELLAFSLAIAFFLAAFYVRFRDATYIWEVIIQAAFYATPILYSLSIVPANFQRIIMLNPMAQIIQDARYLVVTDTALTAWHVLRLRYALVPLVIVVVSGVIAQRFFKKEARYFAENI